VAREGKKVKYVFANTTAQREKKVKSFASEHFRVSGNEEIFRMNLAV
jgi:hypothetical protein